jgi:hypothetical protein
MKIKKVIIQPQARTLTANWTVEVSNDNDIETQMSESLSKEIADEIDFEIMMDLLVQTGWHKVVLRPMTWEDGATIDNWVENNVKCRFHTRGLVWLFEDAKDANWFSMRWL